MDEYIKREVLIANIKDDIQECGEADSSIRPIAYGTILGLRGALSYVETLPAADVAEVMHGEWVMRSNGYMCRPQCSICGGAAVSTCVGTLYCPHCGAKMDGGKKQ